MTFRRWLQQQCRRRDPVGDIARDVRDDDDLKDVRGLTPKSLRRYMQSVGACEAALVALDRARCEFFIEHPQPAA